MMAGHDERNDIRTGALVDDGSCGGSRFAALSAPPKAAWMVVDRGEWNSFPAGALSMVAVVAGLGSLPCWLRPRQRGWW
jgi:hypothetical protein